MTMICPECGDVFEPGDANDGLCPWDDSRLQDANAEADED